MTNVDPTLQLKNCIAPVDVRRNLVRQVMTPLPPMDYLFSDEAINKEEIR